MDYETQKTDTTSIGSVCLIPLSSVDGNPSAWRIVRCITTLGADNQRQAHFPVRIDIGICITGGISGGPDRFCNASEAWHIENPPCGEASRHGRPVSADEILILVGYDTKYFGNGRQQEVPGRCRFRVSYVSTLQDDAVSPLGQLQAH